MGPITSKLYHEIRVWQTYSVLAPALFLFVASLCYLYLGASFQTEFFVAIIVFAATCIAWWHWSLITLLKMLLIMQETDDHFALVDAKLNTMIISAKTVDIKK